MSVCLTIYTILRKQRNFEAQQLKHSTTLSKVKTVRLPEIKWNSGERKCFSLSKKHFLENELLYRSFRNRTVRCIPNIQRAGRPILRWILFSEYHETGMAGHRGLDATYSALSRRFHWKIWNRISRNIFLRVMCASIGLEIFAKLSKVFAKVMKMSNWREIYSIYAKICENILSREERCL